MYANVNYEKKKDDRFMRHLISCMPLVKVIHCFVILYFHVGLSAFTVLMSARDQWFLNMIACMSNMQRLSDVDAMAAATSIHGAVGNTHRRSGT